MKKTFFSVFAAAAGIFIGTYTMAAIPTSDTSAPIYVTPGGETVGIRMYTDGLLVVADSGILSPARAAGIKRGDVITEANGLKLKETSQLSEMVAEGRSINIRYKRGEKYIDTVVTPEEQSGAFRIGVWLRDSAAGLGTVTFYCDNDFAALGHAVTDADTGDIMTLSEGSIASAQIIGVTRGKRGSPGELNGTFDNSNIGIITKNTSNGLYGKCECPPDKQAIPIAARSDVHEGSAYILADIDGSGPKQYSVDIERISFYAHSKALVVHITDMMLTEKTGGIVQGMSGAPIIQDGKLAGAVTHVFVNDPGRGYGIFAESMYHDSLY